MKIFPDFAPNSRKERRLLLFESKLRKQIRKLPKILKFVRISTELFTIIQNYSLVSLMLPRPEAPRWSRAITAAVRPKRGAPAPLVPLLLRGRGRRKRSGRASVHRPRLSQGEDCWKSSEGSSSTRPIVFFEKCRQQS